MSNYEELQRQSHEHARRMNKRMLDDQTRKRKKQKEEEEYRKKRLRMNQSNPLASIAQDGPQGPIDDFFETLELYVSFIAGLLSVIVVALIVINSVTSGIYSENLFVGLAITIIGSVVAAFLIFFVCSFLLNFIRIVSKFLFALAIPLTAVGALVVSYFGYQYFFG